MLAIRRNSSAIHRWTKSGPKQLHVYRDGYPQRVVGSRFIKFNDPALFACRVVPGRTRLIHNFYPGGQQKYSPHRRKSRSGYLSVYCTYFSFFLFPSYAPDLIMLCQLMTATQMAISNAARTRKRAHFPDTRDRGLSSGCERSKEEQVYELPREP
jgi:hypothetical protein